MKLYILPSLFVLTALAFMSSSFVANDSNSTSNVKVEATMESNLIGSWSLSEKGRTYTYKKVDKLSDEASGFTFLPEGKLIKRHSLSLLSDKEDLKDFNGVWRLDGKSLTMTYTFDGGQKVREVVEIQNSSESLLEWKKISSIELHEF